MKDSTRCSTCGASNYALPGFLKREVDPHGVPHDHPVCVACVIKLLGYACRDGNKLIVQEIEADQPAQPALVAP